MTDSQERWNGPPGAFNYELTLSENSWLGWIPRDLGKHDMISLTNGFSKIVLPGEDDMVMDKRGL